MKLTQQLAYINGGFSFKEDIQEPAVKFYKDHKGPCDHVGFVIFIALEYYALRYAAQSYRSYLKRSEEEAVLNIFNRVYPRNLQYGHY